MNDPANRLRDVLGGYGRLAVAVSGGVDSLTLAFCAARWVPDILAIHAVSPAVPAEATERVRRYAETNGCPLKVVSSGEFKDPNYRANPHNRCYFCKSNLYTTMTELFDGPVASGTNTDDLGDYRPGLVAAQENAVVHPFVEAGIGKDDLRAIARLFDLQDIAELPAQPCLSSRVETGIRITGDDLRFIHQVETALRPFVPLANLRCRITAQGVRIESDLDLPPEARTLAEDLCSAGNRTLAGLAGYARGSAFLVPDA